MTNIFKTAFSWFRRSKPVFEPAQWNVATPPEWGTVERWRYEKSLVQKQQLFADDAKRAFRKVREDEALRAEALRMGLEGVRDADTVKRSLNNPLEAG